MQYVQDVADIFIECTLGDVPGAHVFNLAGDVVEMKQFISLLERLRPGASNLITSEGPQVPVAYKMSDSALRALFPAIPKTPLEQGIRATLDLFERLR
jgi:nucleoside-diphosphate-sugar epimerase